MLIVKKDWGEEHVIVNEAAYCGKVMRIKPGWQCSLHHHEEKDETFYVTIGPMVMQVGDEVRVAARGMVFRIPPGTKHRFAAIGRPAEMTEFSSHHDDGDVVRHEPTQEVSEEFKKAFEDEVWW